MVLALPHDASCHLLLLRIHIDLQISKKEASRNRKLLLRKMRAKLLHFFIITVPAFSMNLFKGTTEKESMRDIKNHIFAPISM